MCILAIRYRSGKLSEMGVEYIEYTDLFSSIAMDGGLLLHGIRRTSEVSGYDVRLSGRVYLKEE